MKHLIATIILTGALTTAEAQNWPEPEPNTSTWNCISFAEAYPSVTLTGYLDTTNGTATFYEHTQPFKIETHYQKGMLTGESWTIIIENPSDPDGVKFLFYNVFANGTGYALLQGRDAAELICQRPSE